MKDWYFRVAACTPEIRVADPAYNADRIVEMALAAPVHTGLLVFPELCVTGYTCGDLFFQPTLLKAAERAVASILERTVGLEALLLVGVPVAAGTALYNCAAVCHQGSLLGLVPKTALPNYGEFYEARWFSDANDGSHDIVYAGQEVGVNRDALFACAQWPEVKIGVEICEDLWITNPPSVQMAQGGATVIANLSASTESVGKPAYRKQLVAAQSARLVCAYVLADAGEGESTTDVVFSGHNLIAENGVTLAESERFTTGIVSADVDIAHLIFDRQRMTTFRQELGYYPEEVPFSFEIRDLPLHRRITPAPFIPVDKSQRENACEEILGIQSAGLARRLAKTGSKPVVGLSGGLDSALALLVIARACDRLGRPHADIQAVTMPGFGTTGRTLGNAKSLADACGATLHEIDISRATTQHLSDIRHDGSHDVTYENAQARERTQVLMDLANRCGGLVVGTGDLSELALGWATYNGDHMSMYGVNASVPKTLVRYLVSYEAGRYGGVLAAALTDILNTPVSPELLPPENGEIAQKTEDIVGPYDLHDFFLYHMLRFGDGPAKIFRLAKKAFDGRFSDGEIARWLAVFCRRFFAQQFKRSCLPDGPRVGSVALSPRGDWRMPSDAEAALWLAEAEACAGRPVE